ncbi:beta-ketoacyl-[acyl-carrier-protein] synthase family protein [Bdellovibrio sp. SKB1291214]|uniref:beta-ketoacyl-[acyl-carrier-protein] synthase family protein n=1 Tax=Bdellovibrio sp. SKB1291214 TaxID=1732569 RepID=UPI000B51E12A|nr:beta-ketoacyl-[acyl-carrier-protein] synthase family protein [Bdellovibrio sp. SKB1291214]UYL09606.1 beta-ketoacyl-[acyl-carrier-protein] synthase family protein [Bdellovibrio sp. SKB1291214]
MKSIKVVGLGAACANGVTKEEIFASIRQGSSAILESGLAVLSENQWQQISTDCPEEFRDSRCSLLNVHSLKAALKEAGWSPTELHETGFIFASTTSQIDQWEKHLPFYKTSGYDLEKIKSSVANQSLGTPALKLAKFFGINGPVSLITSSCTASLQAITMATLWIRTGKVKRCIVGATEIQSDLTRIGFGSLRLLSKDSARPFDKARTGINLGEGSAFMCLEESTLRLENPWGFITGIGLSTDAYHATSPHPEGLGSQRAIEMALDNSKVSADEIKWIYSHGTGSPANDLAEAKAIHKIFPHRPFVTSTKSSHGHTLGASGALESVLGLMAMKEQVILPTAHCENVDENINLEVLKETLSQTYRHFLKNSLGFGGINASVVFSAEAQS